ncbi:MAG: zf-HC2 domain-containing protein [Deltaproteobacteria bacterium]
MTAPIRLPHSDPDHPLREASAYLHDELSPEERVAFEAHLSGCDRCPEALAVGRKLLPIARGLLADEPALKTGQAYAALLKSAQAKLSGEAAAPPKGRATWPKRRSWRPYWPWLVAGSAIAAGLLVLARPPPAVELERVPPKTSGILFAPPKDIPPEVSVTATVTKDVATVRVARLPDDRYVAIAAYDARGGVWLAQAGERPDPRCTPRCGPFELRVKLDRLPPGSATLMALVSPTPMPTPSLYRLLTIDVPLPGQEPLAPRAIGEARISH